MGFDDDRDGEGRRGFSQPLVLQFGPLLFKGVNHTCIIVSYALDPSVVITPKTDVSRVPSVAVQLRSMEIPLDVLKTYRIRRLSYKWRANTEAECERRRIAAAALKKCVRSSFGTSEEYWREWRRLLSAEVDATSAAYNELFPQGARDDVDMLTEFPNGRRALFGLVPENAFVSASVVRIVDNEVPFEAKIHAVTI